MSRRRWIIAGAATGLISLGAVAAARASDAPRLVTGFVAHTLCSATFVSDLSPDLTFNQTVEGLPGVSLIRWMIGYSVDRARRQVTATVLGGVESRAIFRDGLGCMLDHGGPVDAALPPARPFGAPLLASIAGPGLVAPQTSALATALSRAFAEPDGPPFRNTRAVVVLHRGRIIAERYAAGISLDTRLQGWSATKSVINALVGILVRQGRLSVAGPLPIAAWRQPGDPRGAITLDHLMRHTSGLAMGQSLQSSLASATAPVNRMKFLAHDMAAVAMAAPLEFSPGTGWTYHDGNTILTGRLIRDAVGGHAADVAAFARRELFEPLGMASALIEFDGTGTPEGSSQMFATARDWARFGQLFLANGMAGGRRILPEGWTDYSSRPTPAGWVGYGAGFWTNRGDSYGARHRREVLGLPADAFQATGTFGQYVVIIPSRDLVVVRLGLSAANGDMEGLARLIRDVVGAVAP
ncbi:serine hydrolase [Phreatobacter aquaticus]|uniref:Serine hydrolase n=1 Tax=Phreatobacter aquaticus TaxID=2570229 RepID=A0A4D7QRT4_9HYPH|nr:serine hydrolase [Phreatobacter aquaticus]QCK86812.1 serine hydrolase [Phreatobacter aquaticus]